MVKAVTPSGADASNQKPQRQSRQEMLDQIERGRTDLLNEELKVSGSAVRVDLPAGDDEDTDQDDAAAETERKRLEAEAAAADDGELQDAKKEKKDADIYDFLEEERLPRTKVKLKVDGKEQEVVIGDVLKDVQKYRAADKRLEDAALVKKRADEDAAATKVRAEAEAAEIIKKARESVPHKDANADEGGGGKEKGSLSKDAIGKAVKAIYEGDNEEAAAALSDEIDARVNAEVSRRVSTEKSGGATVDKASIVAEVRGQVAWDEALDEFKSDHEDIATDPYLLGMWQAELNTVAAEASSPRDAVARATAKVTTWLDSKVSGSAGGKKVITDDAALAKRRTEKAAAEAASVRSSTSVKAPLQDAKAEAPYRASDEVAAMKAARGQS